MDAVDAEGGLVLWTLLDEGSSLCSSQSLDEEVLQSAFLLVDTSFHLCSVCRSHFSDGLTRPDAEFLRRFKCASSELAAMGLMAPPSVCEAKLSEPSRLFLLRRALDQALEQQKIHLIRSAEVTAAEKAFLSRLDSGYKTVMVYEDPLQQYSARNSIDFERVHSYAVEYLEEHSGCAEDEALLRGLLRWFKNDFFRWCNQPACSNPNCTMGNSQMDSRGVRAPNSTEVQFGWAGRTEVYSCRACSNITDFPRYNNPSSLLSTRSGRCGEWANAFCLICRALCLDARYVLDFTDHVWVEVWLPSQNRFVHLDPCEQAFDSPLLYEAGWGKKLTHLLSFSRYGVAGEPNEINVSDFMTSQTAPLDIHVT